MVGSSLRIVQNSSCEKTFWILLVVAALALAGLPGNASARTLSIQTDRGVYDVPIDDISLQFWIEDEYGMPVTLGDPDLAISLYVAAARVHAIAITDFDPLAASLDQIHAWSTSLQAAAALEMADERALRRALASLAERVVASATGGASLDGQAGAAAAEALNAVPGNAPRAQFLLGIAQVAATRELVQLYRFDRAGLLNAISTGAPVSFQLIDRLYALRGLIEATAQLGPHTALLAGLRGGDGFWRSLVEGEGRAGVAALQALAGATVQDGAGGNGAAASPDALVGVAEELFGRIEVARAASRLSVSTLERDMALFNLTEMGVFADAPAPAAEAAEAVPVPAEPEPEPVPAALATFRDCAGCPEMVVVPPGSFTMGPGAAEAGRSGDNPLQRQVAIAQPFAIGAREVTFAQWDACVAAGGCSHVPDDEGWGRGDMPVVNIGWEDAIEYATWLSAATGQSYRLPTEAEWEYAARAGTATARHWGEEPGVGRANCDGCGSRWDGRRPAPTGSFPPNGFGLYDMLGNVQEWTRDCLADRVAGTSDGGRLAAAEACAVHVQRGGSWASTPEAVRAAARSGGGPFDRSDRTGFRLARTVSPQDGLEDAGDAPPEAAEAPVETPPPDEEEAVEEPAPADMTRFRDCAGCPEMVVVPGGRFTMGSSPGETGHEPDEGPPHEVSVRSFAIGRFEVTFAQWDACVAAGACTYVPHDQGWGRGNRPVVNVAWRDITAYLDWLSRRTGHRYRLPSEAEWEYAARAGSDTLYWWGDEIGSGNANCARCGSEWDGRMTAPVGSFPPNAFGLHDMLGNVTEWVADCYRPNYHLAPTDGSVWWAETVEYYVGRGGSWYSAPLNLRAANRMFAWPWLTEPDFGFRVARSL